LRLASAIASTRTLLGSHLSRINNCRNHNSDVVHFSAYDFVPTWVKLVDLFAELQREILPLLNREGAHVRWVNRIFVRGLRDGFSGSAADVTHVRGLHGVLDSLDDVLIEHVIEQPVGRDQNNVPHLHRHHRHVGVLGIVIRVCSQLARKVEVVLLLFASEYRPLSTRPVNQRPGITEVRNDNILLALQHCETQRAASSDRLRMIVSPSQHQHRVLTLSLEVFSLRGLSQALLRRVERLTLHLQMPDQAVAVKSRIDAAAVPPTDTVSHRERALK